MRDIFPGYIADYEIPSYGQGYIYGNSDGQRDGRALRGTPSALSFSAPDPWAETGTFLGRIGAGGPKGAYAPGLWFVANVEWSDGSGYCMGSPTAKGNDYEVRIL